MHFLRRPEHHAALPSVLLPALLLAAGMLLSPALAAQSTPLPQSPIPPTQTTLAAPATSQSQSPNQSPDQDADGLPSLHALPSTLDLTQLDGLTLTQSFTSVPAGSGQDPGPDPADDADAAELATGPSHGLSRGRHAGAAYLFAPSTIREFRVTANAYTAATAQSGGTLTEATTRAGTPAFHGEAYFALRSSAFAAHDPEALANTFSNGVATSNPVKPHDLRERFGATLSGPIPTGTRTRTLTFFYAFDAQRRGFPAIASPADPNFFALTPGQLALLGNRGVTAPNIAAALNSLAALTGPVDRRGDQTLHFARLDYLRHPRLPLSLEATRLRWTSPAGLTTAPVVARGRGSLGDASGSLTTVLLRAEAAFTPRLSSQFHLAYLRDLQYETAQASPPPLPGALPGALIPEVNIAPNGFLFGTPATLSSHPQPDERRIELAAALTYTRGRSLFTLGGAIASTNDTTATQPANAGVFLYDSGTTRGFQGGLVDFITDATFNANTIPNGGCPSIFSPTHLFCFQSFTQSFGAQQVAFSTQLYTAFAQQDLRLTPRLTAHLGLRYEYTLLPIPTTPNPALDAVFAARASTAIFPEDRNNFAPRAALAWHPRRTGLTLRAGYGLFYGRLPGATLRAALSETALPASVSKIRITPSVETACPTSANGSTQGFGYPCAFLTLPTGTSAAARTTSAFVFDRHFRLPAIQQGTLILERTFPGRTVLSAAYLINLDRQLPGSVDLNIAPSTTTQTYQLQGGTGAPGVRDGETFTLPLYTARLTPLFGPVTQLTSHANGTYNALRLTAFTAPTRALTASATYTWSKGLDTAPNLSATPRTSTQLDPFTNGYDKALSSLNQPWSLHAEAVWSPTVAPRTQALGRILNGFTLTPILIARAGRPYSFDLSGGPSLPGGHQSINSSGGALYLPTLGRNTLRLPRTLTTDLRLTRTFTPRLSLPRLFTSRPDPSRPDPPRPDAPRPDPPRPGTGQSPHSTPFARPSRLHIEMLAEAFNLFNTRNLSSINQRAYLRQDPIAGIVPLVFQSAAAIATEGLNTTPFATPTAASTSLARARQLQFQLRLQF